MMNCLDCKLWSNFGSISIPGVLLANNSEKLSQTALALKCISAIEGNRSEDSVAAHRLDDVKADVGEDPLHVVVDRLPVLLDVPVPRLVHQAA